ncbi:hypothetical protein ACHAWU_006529 [Discostella pseudostelligera]|uniref:RING-CH-type domain-containing protein n=1 Tax=Discostella pseudostelligera TaxID=259834 RepID=A0ABD3MBZ0_9STRA
MNTSTGAACWICLDEAQDDAGKTIVRDCACRGNDAGFAHMSCIIRYAEQKCEQAVNSEEFVAPWGKCPNCDQNYQNDLSIDLSDAFVSFAKRKYEYPGNHPYDKMKVMEALKHQIQSNKSSMLAHLKKGDVSTVAHIMQNRIHKLLEMVDQTKKELDMDGLVHETLMCSEFEAFGYHCLGQLCSLEESEENTDIQVGYYEKARDIYQSVGNEFQVKHMTDFIDSERARLEGDETRQLENTKRIYENKKNHFGENSEPAILTGIAYALDLRTANFSIKAERLLIKLEATSRQVYGEEHKCTKQSREFLDMIVKRRLVRLSNDSNDKIFQALRYENDGEICVIIGPIEDDEGRPFGVASTLIYPDIGCPVICHGLINAPHLNGKLGDVRSYTKGRGGELRCGVYFEDKSLKSVAVRPLNLRIAFDLPDE